MNVFLGMKIIKIENNFALKKLFARIVPALR